MTPLPFPAPPLHDELVSIRPWEAADVTGGLMLFADPLVHTHSWPHVDPYTTADARSFFAEQEAERLVGSAISFALVAPADDRIVLGGASLYDVDCAVGMAAIGYWLAAEARGRGVATHAVRLLAGWAFQRLDVVRLELTCGPDNIASQAVADRCGFVREGTLRSHLPFKNERRDSVIYRLLRGELS